MEMKVPSGAGTTHQENSSHAIQEPLFLIYTVELFGIPIIFPKIFGDIQKCIIIIAKVVLMRVILFCYIQITCI